MVWIGLGQEKIDCPKCGKETAAASSRQSKSSVKKRTATASKAKAQKRNHRTTNPRGQSSGKLLVPTAQLNRLSNLLDEISKDISRSTELSPLKTFNTRKTKVTYQSILSFQQHISTLLREGERAEENLRVLRKKAISEIDSLQTYVKSEGAIFRNLRKLSQSISGEQTTEKSIKTLKALAEHTNEQASGFAKIIRELQPLEKKVLTLFSTPAAKKWSTMSNLTLAQLEKATVQSESEKIGSTKKSHSRNKTESKEFLDYSETDKVETIRNLYPELSKVFLDHHRNQKSSKSIISKSAEGVWLLGQAWLVFLDGDEMDLTDDVRIYNLISEISRKPPRCSVEQEASIFMHNVSLGMTEFEMRIGLRMAVAKLGHGLVLNGNFEETLASLIQYQDRSDPRMIGK